MSLTPPPALQGVQPQLFVSDMQASVTYFRDVLGFALVFLHGEPAFYGQVQRGPVRLNLRHVDQPVTDQDRAAKEDLLCASIETQGLAALLAEFQQAGAFIHQPLRREPWGADTVIVADPDGNLLLFTGPRGGQ